MTIPGDDYAFQYAINEVMGIINGSEPSETPTDEFGLYKELIEFLRDDYSDNGTLGAVNTWEKLRHMSMYAPIDMAIQQGWKTHNNSRYLTFVEILRAVSHVTTTDEIKSELLNLVDDCTQLTPTEILQLRQVAQSQYKVPGSWLNSWQSAIKQQKQVLSAKNGAGGPVNGVAGGGTSAVNAPVHNLTDLGNAKRLVDRFGKDIRYIHAFASWYIWDGARWRKDETGHIVRLAKSTAMGIYGEAANISDPDVQGDVKRWAHQSESERNLMAMINLGRSEPGVPIMHNELDSDPYLFNVMNGTINLVSGHFKRHDKGDLLSKLAPIEYDPDAICPIWDSFMTTIMSGDMSKVEYLQKAVGYSLTGDTSEQVMFFCYGRGNNGKSTFLEVLMHIMGDYAVKSPTEMVMANKFNVTGIPLDVARLPGIRLTVAAEVEAGQRLSDAKVKDLTGKDSMTGRFMRADIFQFKPSHKLWMYGNYKPVIRGADDGIWRRIHLIPFTAFIAPEDRIPHMMELLIDEASGILNWAIEGHLKYQKEGLSMPSEVSKAVNEYREDMDTLGEWITDNTNRVKGHRSSIADIYDNYIAWCLMNDETSLSKKHLVQRITERGYNKCRMPDGSRGLLDIELRI